MRILLLGNTGQLGWELNRIFYVAGEIFAFDYPEINFLDVDGLRKLIREIHPDLILNAVAFTDVDGAEAEREAALLINGIAPGVLAEEAKRLGATLIHYSTDYVFDGKKGSLYNEDDMPNPLSYYGESKLVGEQNIQQIDCDYIIFRTSWVYSLRRPSFVTKVLAWAEKNPKLSIVTDQVGNPTWCRALAQITSLAVSNTDDLPKYKGIYHLAGGGFASRYQFAEKILENIPLDRKSIVTELAPALSADFNDIATRPKFSALDTTKFTDAFGIVIPSWEQSLALALPFSILCERRSRSCTWRSLLRRMSMSS